MRLVGAWPWGRASALSAHMSRSEAHRFVVPILRDSIGPGDIQGVLRLVCAWPGDVPIPLPIYLASTWG
jgi:hypothetical protein